MATKLNDLHRLLGDGVQQQVLAGNISGLVGAASEAGNSSTFAYQYGGALLASAVEQGGAGVKLALETVNGGSFNISGVIGLVFAAIGRIVKSISNAGEETQRNWELARVTYLSACYGVRQVNELPMVLCGGDGKDVAGGGAGCYRFARPGAAEDRCVPYFDELLYVTDPVKNYPGGGSPLPAFLVPYRLPLWKESAADEPERWGVGYGMPDICESAPLLLLDTGKQDCGDQRFHPNGLPRLTICWAWAWPMTCPPRMCGKIGRAADATVERSIAGLYLLPTAQHVQTRLADVRESERLLRVAMAVYYPNARELAPGVWRDASMPVQSPLSKASFESLAGALYRVHMFKRTRAIIVANLKDLPDEVWPFLGDDFGGGWGGNTYGDCPQPEYKLGAKPVVVYNGDDEVDA